MDRELDRGQAGRVLSGELPFDESTNLDQVGPADAPAPGEPVDVRTDRPVVRA